MPAESPSLVCLIVMDGWGIAPPGPGNAIYLADTPNFDHLTAEYANSTLKASGQAVGLPPGQMGNSEVGHLNLGAGRIVYQDLTRINQAIEDGSFFENEVLKKVYEVARERDGYVHLMGLLSDGGVHSEMGHIKALVEMAGRQDCPRILLHPFLDGRDTPPNSGLGYIEEIDDFLSRAGIGEIATVSGRYYAMDRDNRWDRVKMAYDAMVYGRGLYNPDPVDLIKESYQEGVTDEFILPTVVIREDYGRIKQNDCVIFFNFRPDRARQLTRALTFEDFDGFDRGPDPPLPYFVTMTEYDYSFKSLSAFPPQDLKNVLAEVLASAGKNQLHIAETEKYAHVTFFFNGGVEEEYPGEERILIPSPADVPTYDKKPEMSAREVTDALCRKLDQDGFDFVIVNLANCDMVGHTGDLEATIKAVSVVDECVGRIVEEVESLGGVCIITSDHGNAEIMKGIRGAPETAHTSENVPLIITAPVRLAEGSSLGDIAPTILDLLGISAPLEMSGRSIILRPE